MHSHTSSLPNRDLLTLFAGPTLVHMITRLQTGLPSMPYKYTLVDHQPLINEAVINSVQEAVSEALNETKNGW